MENKIYIFGHRKPDTDSVCSAISLSYLKNHLGDNTEPKILSNINEETKYVLKKFGFKTPEILHDVKLQVSDINYHKDFFITNKESVYNAFFKMQENNMSTIPVVDEKNNFIGAFAMKDIAKKERKATRVVEKISSFIVRNDVIVYVKDSKLYINGEEKEVISNMIEYKLSNDGKKLYYIDKDKNVHLYDVSTKSSIKVEEKYEQNLIVVDNDLYFRSVVEFFTENGVPTTLVKKPM